MSSELTKVMDEKVYGDLLIKIKQQIQSVQAKAALAVNTSLIQLYWNLGEMIADNQALFEGRNNYVAQLEKDLRAEFPELKGFSRSNLFNIRRFYQFYSNSSVQQLVGLNQNEQTISMHSEAAPGDNSLIQQPVELITIIYSVPWGHHVLILDKVKEVAEGKISWTVTERPLQFQFSYP